MQEDSFTDIKHYSNNTFVLAPANHCHIYIWEKVVQKATIYTVQPKHIIDNCSTILTMVLFYYCAS